MLIEFFSGGKGSFDQIENNLPLWKSIFKTKKDLYRRLNVHGCFNKTTLPFMFEGFKYFKEKWDVPSIWFMPIHSDLTYTEEDTNIYKDQLLKIKRLYNR